MNFLKREQLGGNKARAHVLSKAKLPTQAQPRYAHKKFQ